MTQNDQLVVTLNSCSCLLKRCRACKHLLISLNGSSHCAARLTHEEPEVDCQVDELNAWLVDMCFEDLEDAREWLLSWANRRNASVQGACAEAMKAIWDLAVDRYADDVDSCRSILREVAVLSERALRAARAFEEAEED
jgi:hypothetical protein